MEITGEQEENRIRRAATALWQQNFPKLPDGQHRSFIDQLSVAQQDGRVNLQLRVFTSKPFSAAERTEYARAVTARLDTPPDAVAVQFVEIPATSGELVAKARDEKHLEALPSVAQLQASFSQGIESALRGLRLSHPAQMLDHRVTTSPTEPVRIEISYLSDRDIEQDARALIADDIRSRLNYPTAQATLNRVQDSFGPITFSRNQAAVTAAGASPLDRAGQILQQHPTLIVEITTGADQREREGVADERAHAIEEYLVSKWQVAQSRISVDSAAGHERGTMLKLKIVDRGQ